jgi:organic hydroperoxide reductase OsmC/OhrA
MSFSTRIRWTGNTGRGTADYRAYTRDWEVAVPGKPVIPCSNDPAIGGNPALMNPEDLLLSALAGCHMLWFLHLASEAGIVVTGYEDMPEGTAEGRPGGAQRFAEVTLRPRISVEPGADLDRARAIHEEVHKVCFIARSVSFPVRIEPEFVVG